MRWQMKTKTICATLLTASLLVVTAMAQQRRMQLDDLGRLVRVSDPQISPDGKSIVIVVCRGNYEGNRNDADLVLVDVATGSQRTLTSDRRNVSHPRFSPSGDRLAFLSNVAAGANSPARPQIFVM